jgi:opacity protein-like surface antigen
VNKYFAVDVLAEYIQDFEVEAPASGFDFNVWSVLLNVKGYPLSGRFQPYAIAGAGMLGVVAQGDGPDDEVEFTGRVGTGIDVYATERYVVNLEGAYYLPTGDLDDVNFWSLGLGLQYHF